MSRAYPNSASERLRAYLEHRGDVLLHRRRRVGAVDRQDLIALHESPIRFSYAALDDLGDVDARLILPPDNGDSKA